MGIQKLAIAAGLLWLVLHFAIVRALDRRDKRATTLTSRLGSGAALAAAKTVRSTTAYGAVIFGAVWFAVALLVRHNGLDLKGLQLLAARVADAKKTVEHFGSFWSGATLTVSVVTLVWLARAGALNELDLEFQKTLSKELKRLAYLRAAGELPDQQPTAEMLRGMEVLLVLREQREVCLATGVNTEIVDHQLQAVEERISWLDLMRHIDESELLEKVRRPSPTGVGKIANVLTSSGMVTALTKLGKAVSAGSMVLALLSLVGVAGAVSQPDLEHHTVELDELIVQASDADLNTRFEHIMQPDVRREVDATDRALARYLAQDLERSLVRSEMWNRPSNFENEENRRHQARRQILNVAMRRAPDAIHLFDETSDGAAEFVKKFGRLKGLEPGPTVTSSLGERVENDLLTIATRSPDTWGRLRLRFQTELEKFSKPSSLGDMAGTLLGESLGQALSGVSGGPTDIVGKMATDLVKSVGKKTLDRWYRAKFHEYVMILDRGGSLQEASAEVMSGMPGYRAATAREAGALRGAVFDLLPTNEQISSSLESPSLTAIVNSKPPASVVEWARSAPPEAIARLSTFDTFDELFPPTREFTDRTLRALLLNNRKVQPPITELAAERARSFKLLDSFDHVGGVVIGRPPADAGSLDIRDIAWTPVGRGGDLALTEANGRVFQVHTDESSLVFLAASYVADGRETAVTIMNADAVAAQKVHLHPAFLGTAFGCRAIQLDELVFTQIDHEQRWANAERDAFFEQSLYAETALTALEATHSPDAPSALEPYLDALRDECRQDVCPLAAAKAINIQLDSNSSPVTAGGAAYSPGLVGTMRACSGATVTLAAFRKCVKEDTLAQNWGETTWQKVSEFCKKEKDASACAWSIIDDVFAVPESSIVSGVRDTIYSINDLETEGQRPEDQNPELQFMVQIVFRPELTHGGEDEPWRFPALGNYAEEKVMAAVARQPETAKLLTEFGQFTRIQRVFRAALDGHLGDAFPLEKIATIAAATANSVRAAEVPEWVDVRPPKESGKAIAEALAVKGPKRGARISCPPL